MFPNRPVRFSICHATARFPGWKESFKAWMENAEYPHLIDYVLAVHEKDVPNLQPEPDMVWVVNKQRYCSVDNWNCAALHSVGDVIILNADDMFPPQHWDTELRKIIPDKSSEFAIQVSTDLVDPVHSNTIMTLGIISRALYNRWGYALFPEYESIGSDLDMTEHAHQDGVVIQAKHLLFQHRHPLFGYGEFDDVYRHQNRPEAYEHDHNVLARRRANKFAS